MSMALVTTVTGQTKKMVAKHGIHLANFVLISLLT
jgi:hypothetical protein